MDVDVPTFNIEPNIEALLTVAKHKDGDRNSIRDIIEIEQNKVDNTPWLRRTLWPRMFAGEDMKKLVTGISKPRTDERVVRCAWDSVIRLICIRCMDGVKDCSTRGWMKLLFWLNSTDVTKGNSKPFSQHYERDTVKRYAMYWAQLVCLCVRTVEDSETSQIPLTDDQRQSINKLRDVLENGNDGEVDDAMLWVSSTLIQHDEWSGGFSAIQYFIGLLGYKLGTGQWESPNDFTPKLAGIQFCIRVLVLEHTLPTDKRDGFLEQHQSNPLDVFRIARDKWLVEGESTPFDYVHTLMNYGLTAARNAPGKDHIQWSQDGKILYFDGRPLEIVRWKSFVYQCIEKLEDIVIRLMFITVLPDVDLYSVQDNPNNHIIGHYFALGSDDATTEARRRMLNRIVSLNMLVEWQSLDGSWNLTYIPAWIVPQ